VRYSGSVTPYTQLDVAFKVGGYIRSILTLPDGLGRSHLIQAGDRIQSGTVLARCRRKTTPTRGAGKLAVDSAFAAILQTEAAEHQAQAGSREAEAALLGAHASRGSSGRRQLAEEQ